MWGTDELALKKKNKKIQKTKGFPSVFRDLFWEENLSRNSKHGLYFFSN